MSDRRSLAELACRGLLLAYLCWLPLPFGSVTERAQAPLVIGALVICALAAFARVRVIPSRAVGEEFRAGRGSLASLGMTPAFKLWIAGGVLFALVVAVQLVPLPDALLGAISPQPLPLWSDPGRAAVHLFRVIAYVAIFLAAALLLRRHRQRAPLAFILGATAVFEAAYGIREAALQRYSIWGWANKVIFNRVTGTFVNPNHFAHYAAIVMPLGVYIAAQAWHDAAPSGAPRRRRLVRLFEKQLIRFGCGVVIAFACLIAILVAQSRGALIAAVAGFAITGAASGGRRHALRRGVLIGVAGVALVLVVVLLLGLKISRFQEAETATLGGRGVTVGAALSLWKRFPLFGTGLGTFAEVSSMTGAGTAEILINHAHDDYAEIAATTGIAGVLAALVPLFAGYAALLRMTFGRGGEELTWTRRAYQRA